jgi:hypothetical protein
MRELATVLTAALARAVGVPDAVADLIVPVGNPETAFGSVLEGNPLGEEWIAAIDVPGPLLIAYSGTLASDLFDNDPRTWMGPGLEAFNGLCDAIGPALKALDRRLLFRPHARHVLSDPQSCVNFLRDRAAEPFGIAVSPCDFFVRDMVDAKADHFTRIAESVVPKAELFFLEDKRVGEGDVLESCPLGEGILPRSIIETIPDDIPIVVMPHDVDAARTWFV